MSKREENSNEETDSIAEEQTKGPSEVSLPWLLF